MPAVATAFSSDLALAKPTADELGEGSGGTKVLTLILTLSKAGRVPSPTANTAAARQNYGRDVFSAAVAKAAAAAKILAVRQKAEPSTLGRPNVTRLRGLCRANLACLP